MNATVSGALNYSLQPCCQTPVELILAGVRPCRARCLSRETAICRQRPLRRAWAKPHHRLLEAQ